MSNIKRKVQFEPLKMKLESGWYVRVTFPFGGQPQKIDGFKTRTEAREWIKSKSAAWLKEYEGGRYA